MATLSQTAFKQSRDNWSTHKIQLVTYNGPSTYVAGGDALLPSDVGWSNFDGVDVLGVAWNGSAVRLVTYDYTNQKLVWYVPNTGSEASGDLSAYSARLMLIGHG
ncbi:MAG TPA: hypothetical protein VFE84_03930 [Patescibacteria group bacterium]|nr:hypothetical protein [Patescibacteria group bacterium]